VQTVTWPPNDEHALATVCAALAAGLAGPPGLREAIAAGADPLGDAFCHIRAAVERRAAGAFYTPPAMVDAMVRWVLEREPARVVDCGCGSGRFAVALRRGGFEGPLVVVDSDPLAVAMTRAHLAAAGLAPATVVQGDFLTLELPEHQGPTAFVGNPPYLRHHELSPGVKRWAKRSAASLGVEVSGLAGLHVLFLLAVAARSRPGDLGCFVTSAEWLDTGYGQLARELLAGPLGLEILHALRTDAAPFADAMTTAVVFGWRCGGGGPVVVARVDEAGLLGEPPSARSLPHTTLRRQPRWNALLDPLAPAQREPMVPLGTLLRVHRGVATGDNGFFVLPVERARERGLADWLTPCVHRARLVQEAGGTLSAEQCSHGLLMLPREPPEHPALRAYLAEGERRGTPERYLCAHRKPWWRLPVRASPPAVATYMARRPPSFATNPDGCALVNIAHGLYPRGTWSEAWLRELVDWLDANASSLTGHRSYHGGLAKWEPRELESALVPARFAGPDGG